MKPTVKEIAVFGLLGGLMYISQLAMEALPNIHPLAAFITAITLVYREKALYPIYAYVMLEGLFAGFAGWWLPYLYIWTVLWGVVMLLPREMPKKIAPIVYMCVCGGHGLLFGALYAPAQALMYGLSVRATIAWIVAGLPFDAIHGVGDFCMGALVLPLAAAMRLADRAGNRS